MTFVEYFIGARVRRVRAKCLQSQISDLVSIETYDFFSKNNWVNGSIYWVRSGATENYWVLKRKFHCKYRPYFDEDDKMIIWGGSRRMKMKTRTVNSSVDLPLHSCHAKNADSVRDQLFLAYI